MQFDRRHYDQVSVLSSHPSLDNCHDAPTALPLAALRSELTRRTAHLDDLLRACHLLTPLFNALQGVVLFIKDHQARYVLANLTLAQRCGYATIGEMLGLTAADIFPAKFGSAYLAQDKHVLTSGDALIDQLELHLFSAQGLGWCLTQKFPLRNHQDEVIGLAGISQDLPQGDTAHPAYAKMAHVDAYIRRHFADNVSIRELADVVDLSVSQLERYARRIYQLTPLQLLHKQRISHASKCLTETERSITHIGLDCGYSDHSAFSRQFKAVTGLTPQQFRQATQT